MSKFSRRNESAGSDSPLNGTARVDHSITALTRRLRRGDIAVIDILDLDERTASQLSACRPSAVINAQESISGRYPNGGPTVLAEASIPLIDKAGADVMNIRDGSRIRIDGDAVFRGDTQLAKGEILTDEAREQALADAAQNMHVQLSAFTANAMDYVERDSALILDGRGLPAVDVDLEGRHVLIVTGGMLYAKQLKDIRTYLRERKPVIIAIGDSADAAMEHAYAAKIIVGNVESVSERAMRAAATVVVHDPAGADAGMTRADALGVSRTTSDAGIASSDLAVLLAHAQGAEVIVTVGMESRLIDYLQGSSDLNAGTFLTRLQAGGGLVDARTLAQVYRHRYSRWTVFGLVAAGFVALGLALAATPGGRSWVSSAWESVSTWLGLS
ncbi:putative cytokinetic ring protein SteA [Demequina aurantiaca]|uniref:putative cytokinetic ring protein SteA n=1 Tax=Demequina aurantiaca TaxID=676200 RepID=UPI000785429F|nr:putative cytokinetic ring protein SteA [Demequina aurantiaca]